MMDDKCKCGHTKMYHSVMGRCQHRGHDIPACKCIEFTPLDSVHGYPVISPSKDALVEYREQPA
jgi:hypothetical protein